MKFVIEHLSKNFEQKEVLKDNSVDKMAQVFYNPLISRGGGHN